VHKFQISRLTHALNCTILEVVGVIANRGGSEMGCWEVRGKCQLEWQRQHRTDDHDEQNDQYHDADQNHDLLLKIANSSSEIYIVVTFGYFL
jgi:hypothetical protein